MTGTARRSPDWLPFILWNGVFLWGCTTALIFTILMTLLTDEPFRDNLRNGLLVFPLAGIAWGFLAWRRVESVRARARRGVSKVAAAELERVKKTLVEGARILGAVVEPYQFRFREIGSGQGSGGIFATGAFERGDRSLEFSLRRSLGEVLYTAGDAKVLHQAYMRELGVANRSRYPGFSDDPLDGFRHLATDLQEFGGDFLTGDATALRRAAGAAESPPTEGSGRRPMPD